jgi:hypothetical protein
MSTNSVNLSVVPKEFLDELQNNITKLLEQSKQSKSSIKEVISERDAQELFGRKTTWFYEMRKSGRLPFSKVGSKVFYYKSDLLNLFKTNQ